MRYDSAEMRVFLSRKEPPVDDSWRPHNKKTHKKPYGLTLFKGGWNGRIWELTSWYSSERARNDAIAAANKPAKWSPVVAMAKVSR